MKFDPQSHHRRSIRLKGYDYSNAGAYFVTMVVQDRQCLFGTVVNDEMQPSDAGEMVCRWWFELPRKFAHVQTDAFVVMPNHIHGIIIIHPVGADQCVCPQPNDRPGQNGRRNHSNDPGRVGGHVIETGGHAGPLLPTQTDGMGGHAGPPLPVQPDGMGGHAGPPQQPGPLEKVCPSLPVIVQWFKTMTTNEYIRRVRTNGWVPFRQRLWQRNYYEHIIRDAESLHYVRQYIAENPWRWMHDKENPDAIITGAASDP